jgi:uncharacterized protein (DUF697 family)
MAATTSQVNPPQETRPATQAQGTTGTCAHSAASDHDAADPAARLAKAQSIVHRNVLWALGVGLVPIPVVDFLGVSTVQLKMLRELASLYGVDFSEQLTKKLVATLVSGLGSAALGTALAATLFKFVPLIGTSLGVLSMPVLGGAFTLATGRVFTAHFDSGGTILDFKPQAIREHFRAEFERAKQAVAQMNAQEPAKSAPAGTTSAKA